MYKSTKNVQSSWMQCCIASILTMSVMALSYIYSVFILFSAIMFQVPGSYESRKSLVIQNYHITPFSNVVVLFFVISSYKSQSWDYKQFFI